DHLRLMAADARRDVPDHPSFRQNVASIQDSSVPYMDSSVFYQVHAVGVPPFLKKADHKCDRPLFNDWYSNFPRKPAKNLPDRLLLHNNFSHSFSRKSVMLPGTLEQS